MVSLQNIIPQDWKRWRWFRFSVRRFFYLLWTQQASGQICSIPDKLPSSLSVSTTRISALPSVDEEFFSECISEKIDNDMTPDMMEFPNDRQKDDDEDSEASWRTTKKSHRNDESFRFRRRKENALAALELLSVSSLYHPLYGYGGSYGPRVRVSRRDLSLEIGDMMEDDESDDDDCNVDFVSTPLNDQRILHESYGTPYSIERQPKPKVKGKRGRPRKTECRK